MAAVTVTSGYPKIIGPVGATTLYLWRVTGISDADTLDTGLSTNVVDYEVSQRGNPTTQASAGMSSTESSGTITFYPGEDSIDASVYVYATGA